MPDLDGFRGISILLVLLDHLVRVDGFSVPRSMRTMQFIGPVGVDVFFIINGFLITMLLTRELTAATL